MARNSELTKVEFGKESKMYGLFCMVIQFWAVNSCAYIAKNITCVPMADAFKIPPGEKRNVD